MVLARRRGDSLCIATTSEYSLVNLTTSQVSPLGLPISQSSEAPSASTRPSILSFKASAAGDCEFLITSHSADQTLGVFVQSSGDPAAKLIEWESHPRAINADYPHLISLLRDDSIQIHNLETMQKIQTIQLPDLLEPRLLSSGQSTLEVSSAVFDIQKHITNVDVASLGNVATKPFRDYGPIQRHPVWRSMILQSNPRNTRVIATCKNAVQCLCDPVPLADAVSLLRNGRWHALRNLVDAEWERQEMQKVANPSQSQGHSHQLDQLYSLLSLRYLNVLDFYSASFTYPRSTLDVRFVLRLFPDLWSVQTRPQSTTSVPVFAPFVDLMRNWPTSIDESIRGNLSWLYGDSPTIEEDEQLRALYEQLTRRAYDMIEAMLEARRSVLLPDQDLRSIIDTALVRLYARNARTAGTDKLSAFLMSPDNACEPEQIAEAVLEAGARPALAELFLHRRNHERTLEIWTDLIDQAGERAKTTRSVADVIALLDEGGSAELRQKYAFWVVKHDAAAGVKLLAGADLSKSDSVALQRDAQSILRDLRSAGAHEAASQFLEQSVLGSKTQTKEMHEELLELLLTRVLAAFDDAETRRKVYGATQEYIDGGYAEAFVGHLALQAADVGDAANLTALRLKLVMLLQGSQVIDAQSILVKIESAQDRYSDAQSLLAYEQAILLGKLGRDEEALRLLALHLHDANSAEAYCLQGGIVLSPFTASQVASMVAEEPRATLQAYAKLLTRGTRSSIKKTTRQRKDKLLKTLLSIYMNTRDGNENASAALYSYQTATAHLLNTQAMHLSTLEVLPLVPPHWPLKTLETFLTRNLRRESERRHKGLIKRHVELSRSLEVSEQSWLVARSLGGVLQDASDSDDGSEQGGRGTVEEDGNFQGEAKRELIGNVVNALVEKGARAAGDHDGAGDGDRNVRQVSEEKTSASNGPRRGAPMGADEVAGREV